MPTIIATPGDPAANSYLTLAEAQAYWDTKLFTDAWDNSPDQIAALILATRTLNAILTPKREYYPAVGNVTAYFSIGPTWTGVRASDTQALAWPRIGMFNGIGVPIDSTAIPQELKNATAELAGQMSLADRTLDNDAAAQGIASVKAGSVAVTFKNGAGAALIIKVLPEFVWDLLVPSWLTNVVIEPVFSAIFEVL